MASYAADVLEKQLIPVIPPESVYPSSQVHDILTKSDEAAARGKSWEQERVLKTETFLKTLDSVWKEYKRRLRLIKAILRYMVRTLTVAWSFPRSVSLSLFLFLYHTTCRMFVQRIFIHHPSTVLSLSTDPGRDIHQTHPPPFNLRPRRQVSQ